MAQEAGTYYFTTAGDKGRKGGAKYRIIGKDVVFRQDFEKGFGAGTGNIKIWNGDGRWAEMNFERCRCNNLCHVPGTKSDNQVKITHHTYTDVKPLDELKFTIEFLPMI